MKQIKNELVTIIKCEELKKRLLIAIDAGNTYTKVLFLNKSNKEQLFNDNECFLNLEFDLFHTEDFELALKRIREDAYIPKDNTHSIHITGSYAIQHQQEIKCLLEIDVICIDEFLTIAAGFKFALEYIKIENLLMKPVDFEGYGEYNSQMIAQFRNTLKTKLGSHKVSVNTSYPALFYAEGSNSALYYFDEQGSCEQLGVTNSGSQTFLGLAKCVLDTNVYEEIINFASKGDRCLVDSQCKEIFGDSESTYGSFPPEMPLIPFGKCYDYNLGLETIRKEDAAISLVSLYLQNIVTITTIISLNKKISKVYLCGGIFNSNVVQREFQKILSSPFNVLDIQILDFGYSDVLGAMVCDGNNVKNYIKNF